MLTIETEADSIYIGEARIIGNITFYLDKQGVLKCQNEGLSKEQVYLLMKDFVHYGGIMDYSFEPKSKYKKYEYFRKSLERDANYKEVVYCKNEISFLKFLSDMNNKEIYSKYYAEKNRTMHIECAKICESEDRVEYMKKRYGVRSRRELTDYKGVGEE